MAEKTVEMDEMMSNVLAPADRSQFMPAMSIEAAVERYNTITEFVSRVLRRDIDYGIIPGTDKLTLLKPGAEKLTTFFGLSTRFRIIERIEDWTGEAYDNEPFFYYLYRCQLFRGDLLIAEADGSCNSRETKYRYREAQRICPECKQAAIIKGREEFGGGWICFRKKGGCGAKFSTGDSVIESQTIGRIFNPDIADQVNTIQKISQKRSLIAACLLAVNASEFFTQDVEDMPMYASAMAAQAEASASRESRITENGSQASVKSEQGNSVEEKISDNTILEACRSLGKTEAQLLDWLKKKYKIGSISDLTSVQKREVLSFLRSKEKKERRGDAVTR
ncbi:MAG: hypothetical protein AUG51_06225 [Acidobacteria bacterium 13_1_20CM_3_53_8]|nr:MAG: hypothetical protein AUG51_06225 [Acidobacteria bacterium 13_1_20CM_3_53_8]